eukprot:comp19431_c0_seq1/m.36823 comp19431_c0_seq1/g.36823  ORF comp19431_c0_seq1/g.36823 comp19431_c0_seq1/m.36823 type:complete len:405 (-) comp19431_c0_seq1:1099-2313(-)
MSRAEHHCRCHHRARMLRRVHRRLCDERLLETAADLLLGRHARAQQFRAVPQFCAHRGALDIGDPRDALAVPPVQMDAVLAHLNLGLRALRQRNGDARHGTEFHRRIRIPVRRRTPAKRQARPHGRSPLKHRGHRIPHRGHLRLPRRPPRNRNLNPETQPSRRMGLYRARLAPGQCVRRSRLVPRHIHHRKHRWIRRLDRSQLCSRQIRPHRGVYEHPQGRRPKGPAKRLCYPSLRRSHSLGACTQQPAPPGHHSPFARSNDERAQTHQIRRHVWRSHRRSRDKRPALRLGSHKRPPKRTALQRRLLAHRLRRRPLHVRRNHIPRRQRHPAARHIPSAPRADRAKHQKHNHQELLARHFFHPLVHQLLDQQDQSPPAQAPKRRHRRKHLQNQRRRPYPLDQSHL